MQSPKMVKNKAYQTEQLKKRSDRMRLRRKTAGIAQQVSPTKRAPEPQQPTPVNQSNLVVMDTAELSQTNTTYMRCASREIPDSPTHETKENQFGAYNSRS